MLNTQAFVFVMGRFAKFSSTSLTARMYGPTPICHRLVSALNPQADGSTITPVTLLSIAIGVLKTSVMSLVPAGAALHGKPEYLCSLSTLLSSFALESNQGVDKLRCTVTLSSG